MILYHLEKEKYGHVWPPEGSLFAAGRWNKPGDWVIYTSPTIALAKLEILANESQLPVSRVCMTLLVDDMANVWEVEPDRWPANWHEKPYPAELTAFTAEFLRSGQLLMKVPSAQSFREHNYLIHVRHPRFHQLVELLEVRPEPFDPRLKATYPAK